MNSANNISLTFLGAAGTVTGSRHLLSFDEQHVLIDCGLFQGYKHLREKNWKPFPFNPSKIGAIFLTHAHLDHSGYIPALIKQGFKGPIFCSPATRDLSEILLLDAAKLQEEEANFHNRHQTSKHVPALPLFSTSEAVAAIKRLSVVHNGNQASFGPFTVAFHRNGHILGSAFLDVAVNGKHILFTGDLGRPNDLMMPSPESPVAADYIVTESTYGDRLHDQHDLQNTLAEIINKTVSSAGSVLIPSFAVGRAQLLLHLLQEMKTSKLIPALPIYLDSPMAIKATELLPKHLDAHRLNKSQTKKLFSEINFCRTVEESIALNDVHLPAIIISASGMATGGRVLHHMKRMIGNHRNTLIFAGYQSGGTRGARLVNGEKKIKIHGRFYPVNAAIYSLDFLSAHADRNEILDWLSRCPTEPNKCFVVHGEENAADSLRCAIQDELAWEACTPEMGETVVL